MQEYYGGFINRRGDGMKWDPDGTRVNLDHEDLVAEWVEPEPAAAPEKPKFKVGDRVRTKATGDHGVVATRTDGVMSIQYDFTDAPGFEWWTDDELELVEPATPLAVGAEVVLSGPAAIRQISGDRASLLMPSGGAFTLPVASLRVAA